jgi:hypothetical protein
VLAAAEEASGSYAPEFACEPLRLRILVQPEGGLVQEPAYRLQGHLYAIVSDACNFAQIDLETQRGFLYVSQQTAASLR